MKPLKPFLYIAVSACHILLLGLAGCGPGERHDSQRATAPPSETDIAKMVSNVPEEVLSNDRTGWFKTADTIIPVFKIDDTYYSVCGGFEVPLEETREGLEWAVKPSSMEGTLIGFDSTRYRYYLSVVDRQLANFYEDYVPGERQPLMRIAKPSGLLDATAPAPHTNDDFVGWYRPIWLPGVGIEIGKKGQTYIYVEHVLDESGRWKDPREPDELTPLPDRLGFTISPNEQSSFTYNESRHRFEITLFDRKRSEEKRQPDIIRMPLARIASAQPGEAVDVVTLMRIGIPSWH